MHHAIIDTNVLIRSILKPQSSDGIIFRQFLSGNLMLYYSEKQLLEIGRVLTYPRIQKKYQISIDSVTTFLKIITTFGILITPSQTVSLCRDPDDNELISTALSVEKKDVMLITGDMDLLVLRDQLSEIIILTAHEFVQEKLKFKNPH